MPVLELSAAGSHSAVDWSVGRLGSCASPGRTHTVWNRIRDHRNPNPIRNPDQPNPDQPNPDRQTSTGTNAHGGAARCRARAQLFRRHGQTPTAGHHRGFGKTSLRRSDPDDPTPVRR
jgi:hypothetical protein